MRSLVEKLSLEKDAVVQWHTQAGHITTNLKVKVDFTLTEFSVMDVMTWNCHVDYSAKGILYKYVLPRIDDPYSHLAGDNGVGEINMCPGIKCR